MSETPTAILVCPKCQGSMGSYERNGIMIDQCQQCRGVFLDRGELERLIDAEEQRYSLSPPQDKRGFRDEPSYRSGDDYRHGDSKHSSKYGNKRRRGGFLGELFD